MNKYSYILIDRDPGGRSCESTYPLVIKGDKLYAVEEGTGNETSPFYKAELYVFSYAVYRGDKGGIIDVDESPVIDCKYDNVYV